MYCLNVSEPELQLVTFYVALMKQLRERSNSCTHACSHLAMMGLFLFLQLAFWMDLQ